MKHLHTFESFVNEAKLPSISLSKLSELPENTLVKVSLSQTAADSIKRDLKANGVKHEEESKTIILMNNTPKARTAIKLAIERFGIRSVMIDTQGTRIIESAEGAIDEVTNMIAKLKISVERKYIHPFFKYIDQENPGTIDYPEFEK